MKYVVTLVASLLAPAVLIAAEKAPSAEETAIRQVLTEQVTAWNKGDLPGFMTGYWKSKELTFFGGADKHQGWDAAFERYKKRYQGEGREMGQLSFAELEVQVVTPEYALVKGRWKVELKKEERGGLFTLVMKKIDRAWVIVHDHTSG
jgi:uncharacterized protein (TIGR02246 family)